MKEFFSSTKKVTKPSSREQILGEDIVGSIVLSIVLVVAIYFGVAYLFNIPLDGREVTKQQQKILNIILLCAIIVSITFLVLSIWYLVSEYYEDETNKEMKLKVRIQEDIAKNQQEENMKKKEVSTTTTTT
jgi:amino acid transporter